MTKRQREALVAASKPWPPLHARDLDPRTASCCVRQGWLRIVEGDEMLLNPRLELTKVGKAQLTKTGSRATD